MTTRLKVRHVSRYVYGGKVMASFNEARLSPLVLPWQNALESMLYIDSDGRNATWEYAYYDYWGTWVRAFEIQNPHTRLTVEAVSTVEVDDRKRLAADLAMTWEQVRSAQNYQRFGEFLAQTERTRPTKDLAQLATEIGQSLGPHEAALAICNLVREKVTYVPGSTGVNTSAAQSWRAGAGVCQDYAHIVIGALRHIGLPARYISGYLHPDADAPIGLAVAGESHAWVQWWLSEWVGHDPTNDQNPGERHVLVATGRDYTDAPPIKGLVAGSAEADLSVTVEITRLS